MAVPVRRPAVPGLVIVVAAMASVQLGNALSVPVFDEVGAFGAAWLRITFAALILCAVVRPRVRSMSRGQLLGAVALGVSTGVMSVAYAGAIDRIPLGTASALEFLGPLGVALMARTSGRAGVLVPVLAGAGVVMLTEPWQGSTDGLGVAFALIAAAGWACYILLTRSVGAALPGLTGLALSFSVAAVAMTPVGLASAWDGLAFSPVAKMAGLALILPLIPFALEMVALRRIPPSVFGILMCLEPGVGLLFGFALLDQDPRLLGLAGLVCVMVAGAWAQRSGAQRRANG